MAATTSLGWREALAPYARPCIRRSTLDLLTSVVPYVLLTALGYALADVSVLLVLLLALPSAGFLLRTYIMFHDCAHGSLLPSKRANVWLGTALGILVWTPYANWKHDHAVHHATAGDLDRRGVGDVPTLTVAEYRAKDRKGRLGYRLFRNPLVMFGLGPIWAMIIGPRLTKASMRPRLKRSVWLTNLALLVIVGGLCLAFGPLTYLLVQGPAMLIAGAAGVWLFYVQHQFEDVYWADTDSWSYDDAALQGSSYLRLPKVLQFFTGNIGLHHVHHLSARIPNYNLQRAHDDHDVFHRVPTITMWDGLKASRLKLYDEESGRLVTFAEARRPAALR
jgi:acyl-lipid omega-6 desaturase (Delta-12 desaturase)